MAGFLLNGIVLSFGVATLLLGMLLSHPEAVYNFIKPLRPKTEVFPYEDRIWTASGVATNNTEIRPFKVHVSEEELTDLRQRLKNTRYGPAMADIQFTYGFPSDQLRKVSIHA